MKVFSKAVVAASLILVIQASPLVAGICDYRPSALLGPSGSTAVGVGGAGVAAGGIGLKAAGFYTLTHSVTGATMLASTAGGASAAGTVGIMGGTAGVIGGTAAFLASPIVIALAGVAVVGIAASEGACYFTDVRVTDHDKVLAIMADLAERADPTVFRLINRDSKTHAMIQVRRADGRYNDFFVRNLYIVNGELLNRDWFKNTAIGHVGFVALPSE